MITSFAEVFIPSEIFYFHCLYLYIFFLILKIYCLKSRRVTETENITIAMSKNDRLMRRGQCFTCGKTKTQSIKTDATVGSFLNTLVNKLLFEMHLPGHNFTGPGTKLYKRLNPDGTPKEWSISINRVDNAAYHRDLYYSKHDDNKTINEVCDKKCLVS